MWKSNTFNIFFLLLSEQKGRNVTGKNYRKRVTSVRVGWCTMREAREKNKGRKKVKNVGEIWGRVPSTGHGGVGGHKN